MTPREIAGWMQYAAAKDKRDAAKRLSINAMAARGDHKVVKSKLKEWTQE